MKITFLLFCLVAGSAMGQSYPDDCLDSIEVAAAFSPNDDRVNDDFSIDFPCPPEEFEFTVYNRWGSEIYKTEDVMFRWIGENEDNEAVQAGVYIWVLKYTFNGAEASKTGSLTLMR